MLTIINGLILLGQISIVALVAGAATFITWRTLNRNGTAAIIAKRDRWWSEHVARHFTYNPQGGSTEHTFLDDELQKVYPYQVAEDEQDGDSRLTMIDHQGTPAPQPGTIEDRWDGTVKSPPFKLMAQEIAWLEKSEEALLILRGCHEAQADQLLLEKSFDETRRFHTRRADQLAMRVQTMRDIASAGVL